MNEVANADVTGKYSKPDVVSYATCGTVVDESGRPTIDFRCKKCRYLFYEPQLIQTRPRFVSVLFNT
jgi:tRNA(Ile2) C34 agmatinyltransferase TiaS